MNGTEELLLTTRQDGAPQAGGTKPVRSAARAIRLALSLAALLGTALAGNALAQGNGRPGGRPGDIGHRDPRFDPRNLPPREPDPGNRQIDPRDGSNGPIITLTLEPAVIYEGQRVTLRWEVRPRPVKNSGVKGGNNGGGRPSGGKTGKSKTGGAKIGDSASAPPQETTWTGPVALRASFHTVPDLPASVGATGSFSFVAGASPERGRFTLTAGGALFRSAQTVEYRARLKPAITRVLVEERRDFLLSERAAWGERIELVGTHFEDRRGDSRVLLTFGAGRDYTLAIDSWADQRIVARVPQDTPVERGKVRILKGPRRMRVDGPALEGAWPGGGSPLPGGAGSGRAHGSAGVHWDDYTLASNEARLRVLGKVVVRNQDQSFQTLAAVVSGGVSIHLSHYDDCTVTFHDLIVDQIRRSTPGFSSPVRFGLDNIVMPVPEDEVLGNLLFRRIVFRINDMNTLEGGVTAQIAEGKLVLCARFESGGVEVKGKAYGRDFDSDDAVRDFQVDSARATVRLRPTVSHGRLAFGPAEAAFEADVRQTNGRNREREDLLRTKFREALAGLADRQDFKNAVAATMQSYFAPDARVVSSAVGSGNSITIKWEQGRD